MAEKSESSLLPVKSGLLKIDSWEHSSQENITLEEKIKIVAEKSTYPVWFSLVLPTYQESKNITGIITTICYLLDDIIPHNYELIVVDDDSPDLTWQIALNLSSQYPQVRVMRRIGEKSLSTAVIRGWQSAQGEILGVIDADLQHPPEILTQLLGKMVTGADLAVASRHVENGGVSNWSFSRRFLSRGAQTLGLLILPNTIGRVSDPMSGYFVLKRQVIADYVLSPVGYKILIEVIARGFIRNIAEVGYVFQERSEGESKVTWRQYRDYLHHLLRLRISLWPFSRFIRFGIVGFSGLFVDMSLLYLLTDTGALNLSLTVGKFISGEFAVINNFIWNDRWTFRDLSTNQKGWHKKMRRFLKFNLICLAGLTINVLLLNLIVTFILPNPYIANLMAIAITTLWNFWINYKLNWRNAG
ncbi:MAG: glycosyltransferase [Cyanobacterium sp. T60_A2020_053]|nr:glycosyltransferase [Cyanobacterium sp. T60_A2020_053]